MMRRIVFFLTVVFVTAACSIARADFISTAGGHGPFPQSGTFMDRGEVWMFAPTPPYNGEFWLGDMGHYYIAHPSAAGMTWLAVSNNYTHAIAYEFEVMPGSFAGRNAVLAPATWTELSWSPAAVVIQYDPPCPVDTHMNTIHVCTGDYTPMDGGGKPTVVISDGLGNPLKLVGNTNHVECEAHLPNYPSVSHPAGLPDDIAAVYVCP